MSGQALWAFVIFMVLAAAALGFFFGRVSTKGMQQKLQEVEDELGRKDAEISAYKNRVESHFDKTATLFVSMAGSYKALFEHLSSGYEQLSDGRSGRDLFRERVATLLLDEPRQAEPDARDATDMRAASVDAVADEDLREDAGLRSDEAEALMAEGHPGPVVPAEIAEAEEKEVRAVDPVQADADGAQAMQAERHETAAVAEQADEAAGRKA